MVQQDTGASTAHLNRRQAVIEIALVFAVFLLQGAWPVPDVNEPYYLGKAIHYWNPHWIPHDFFLDSADSHQVFCLTFGWLALWLPPLVLAWVGRLLTWGLLAWGWWRLSWAVVPRRWISVLTAALFMCVSEHCSMAGEWVVGGVEAKGFAYVLVLLGIEAVVRGRWNRAWLFFGAGALFHVLVGGWAVLAAGCAWLLAGPERPKLRWMLPGLLGGLLLSLPALIPALGLTWGTGPPIVRQANEIYVYQRLSHHLVLSCFPTADLARFGGLLVLWLVLCRFTPRGGPTGRLQGFVAGTIAIAALGMAINTLVLVDPVRAAGLLRFYWFRMADVAVPLGVVLLGLWWVEGQLRRRPALSRGLLAGMCVVALVHVGGLAIVRSTPTVPRTIRPQDYYAWRDVCDWIARSPDIPPDARFLTPQFNQTFQWYTARSEVVSWKNIPQDARSIVQWWDQLEQIYGTGLTDPRSRWRYSLAVLPPRRLQDLGRRYGAQFLVTEAYPPLDLPVLYRNRQYVVYRLMPDNPR